MPRLIAPVLIAAALPVSAAAQSRPSLLDLLSPDRILRSAAQSGIMALRTQMDIKYGAMDIDLAAGRVTMTDLRLWPLPEWDAAGDCEIVIDRLTLRTAAVDEPDRIRLKVQAQGASAPPVCLPEEPRGAVAMAGLDVIDVPRLTLDLDYDVRGSGADAHLFATITDVATANMSAAFSYVWVDGREDMEEPDPVMFLESATLSVENLGVWDVLKEQVPPDFTGANAGLVVEGAIGAALAEANRDAAGPDAEGDPGRLTESQRAFLDSAKAAWPAFLDSPETLVLETAIDGDAYLDFAAMEDDPRVVFDTLQPRLALAPARAAEILPGDLLRRAVEGGADGFTAGERREVGLALVTGRGAPRNIPLGLDLLSAAAEAGDGPAALALAQALETRAPEAAYRWALRAGAAGETGATAQLDRMEDSLSFAGVLKLQGDVSDGAGAAPEALASVASVRERAAMRLSGRGLARSYGLAAAWAMIGAAAGDTESADILADIDARVRLAGAEGRAAWTRVEAAASERATRAWLANDLAARFAR